jgi:hypothetical protein
VLEELHIFHNSSIVLEEFCDSRFSSSVIEENAELLAVFTHGRAWVSGEPT